MQRNMDLIRKLDNFIAQHAATQNDYKLEAWIKGWMVCAIPSAEFTEHNAKRALIYLFGEKCQGTNEDGSPCEWARTNSATGKIPFQLDHINGDSSDSRPENVRLLCPGCHALTPTYGALNKGQGRGRKKQQQQSVNYLISEVARRTGRTSFIENEPFVLVRKAVPNPNPEELATSILRKQRFLLKK